jgi:hypothetical protein
MPARKKAEPKPRHHAYLIRHHSEETDCDQCGCPLYVADTVYTSDDDCFCSQSCRDRWDSRRVILRHAAA